jgi:hypothetical protein
VRRTRRGGSGTGHGQIPEAELRKLNSTSFKKTFVFPMMMFICSSIKKGESRGYKMSRYNYDEYKNIKLLKKNPACAEHGGIKMREGSESGV